MIDNPNMYNEKGIVEDWKKMTMMSGNLNPAQLENVKMYPWTIIEGVKPKDLEIKVDYDLQVDFKDRESRKKSGSICYNFVTEQELLVNDDMIDMVHKALQTLFWEDIVIILQYNSDMFWSSRQ